MKTLTIAKTQEGQDKINFIRSKDLEIVVNDLISDSYTLKIHGSIDLITTFQMPIDLAVDVFHFFAKTLK